MPDNLSGPAKFLIRFLLQKDPSARPTCGEILKYSWLNPGAHQQQSSNSIRASSIPPASLNAPNGTSASPRVTVHNTSSPVAQSVSASSSNTSSTGLNTSSESAMTVEVTPAVFDLFSKEVRPSSNDGEDQVVPNIDMD